MYACAFVMLLESQSSHCTSPLNSVSNYMKTKQAFSDQRIIECLYNHYNLDVTHLTPLFLGADINACLFKAQTSDLKSYFVKLKQGISRDISVDILELLHTAGLEQIILPMTTTQGQLTQHVDECTLIVYPYVESQNGFIQMLTDDQWFSLGKALRIVHEFKIPEEIQGRVNTETYSSKWRDSVRSMAHLMDAEPRGDEWAVKLLLFMKEHKPDIFRLVDTAELLSKQIREEPVKNVLCHADIHGGNVLLGPKGSIYIVDWDAPILAPKERDLMFIGGGVANVWNKPHEEEMFYKGYGPTEINRKILAYYRHERIVEDIAIYAESLLLTTAGGDSRKEMYEHFVGMFAPRGVVDIAFKTM